MYISLRVSVSLCRFLVASVHECAPPRTDKSSSSFDTHSRSWFLSFSCFVSGLVQEFPSAAAAAKGLGMAEGHALAATLEEYSEVRP